MQNLPSGKNYLVRLIYRLSSINIKVKIIQVRQRIPSNLPLSFFSLKKNIAPFAFITFVSIPLSFSESLKTDTSFARQIKINKIIATYFTNAIFVGLLTEEFLPPALPCGPGFFLLFEACPPNFQRLQ